MTPDKYEPEYGTMKQSGVGQYVRLSVYQKLEDSNYQERCRMEGKINNLETEVFELKNEIGHWQIKNDALNWGKVSSKIEKITAALNAARDAFTKIENQIMTDRNLEELTSQERMVLKISHNAFMRIKEL